MGNLAIKLLGWFSVFWLATSVLVDIASDAEPSARVIAVVINLAILVYVISTL